MSQMTQLTPYVLGLLLGLGLAGGAPVLAQSAAAESGSTEPSLAWTFDAGVSKVPGLRFGWGSESSTVGGWIGVGSGNFRLNVNYWHSEVRQEETMYDPGLVELSIVDQMDIAGVWRFRAGRAFSPHVLAGVGFDRSRYHSCWDTPIGRRCSGESAVWSVPADSGESLVHRSRSFFVVYGAGIDLALGSRFFVRAQARVYTDPDAYYPLFARVATVIGGGVRF